MKAKKIKLNNLSIEQKTILNNWSNEHRILYNHLLNFTKTNGTSDFKQISNQYSIFRNEKKLSIYSKSAQNTARTFINSIKSFFALHKKDKSHKFPYKFKSYKYFTTFIYDWNNGMGGFKLENNILTIQKILRLELPDYCSDISSNNIKQIIFSTKDNLFTDYCVTLVYAENKSNTQTLNVDNYISIDLGVKNLVTAHSNKITNFFIKTQAFKNLELESEKLQSKRDLRNKKSIKYKKYQKRYLKLKHKLTNKRKDWCHQISNKITKLCVQNNIGQLIVGDIKVKKLKDSKIANKRLNKSTQNLYLSRFKTFLEYKAKNANIAIDFINEAYTSQINCLTGKKELSSELSVRTVKLSDSIEIDRDLNSAINIAKRFLQGKWLTQFLNFDLEEMLLSARYQCLLNICTGEVI